MSDRPLLHLLRHLREHRGAVIRTAISAYLGGALLVTLAVAAAGAVGTAIVEGRAPGWPWWAALTAVVLLRSALTWHEMNLSHDVAFRVLATLRVALFDGVARSSPAPIGGRHSGDLAATAMGDVEKLEFFYAHTVAQMAAAGLLVVTGGGVALLVDPRLAVLVAASGLLLVGTATWGAEAARRDGERTAQARASVSARVVEALSGRREVLGYHLLRRVVADVERVGRDGHRAQARAAARAATTAGARDVVIVLTAAAAVVVAAEVAREGTMSAALAPAVVAAIFGVLAPVADLVSVGTQLHEHRASAARVVAGAETPAHLQAPARPRPLPPGPLGLRLRDVAFDYGDGFRLAGVDLDVPPGDRVVLVGPSGCGKTTLAQLMTRWWDPLAGSVAVFSRDGTEVDLRDVDERELRRSVVLIGQHVQLFSGSLADNVRRGALDLSDAEVRRLLDVVGLGDVLDASPDGLAAQVGQRGQLLSGGQRARLGLARALARHPRVLVLDEVTAHLDPAAERRVTALVQGLGDEITVVTVAHRAATISASGRRLDAAALASAHLLQPPAPVLS